MIFLQLTEEDNTVEGSAQILAGGFCGGKA